jgi:putative transposase
VKAVAQALQVSRSQLAERLRSSREAKRKPYVKSDDDWVVPRIRKICDGRASYGYRRVTAFLNRELLKEGRSRLNHKRIYRIMNEHKLLLQKHNGKPTRTHDGKVITLKSNLRWCSDTMKIRCWNDETIEVAFSLDTCDREAISYVVTTNAMTGERIRDLMVDTVQQRFGSVTKTPKRIQWLTDNGPPYTARETRILGEQLGLEVCTTPSYSPESNGVSEAFVKTFKRDYVYLNRLDDAETVMRQLPNWFEDYNENAPHKGLKMMSPREFRRKT